jgi:hypothetical protein
MQYKQRIQTDNVRKEKIIPELSLSKKILERKHGNLDASKFENCNSKHFKNMTPKLTQEKNRIFQSCL